MWAQCPSRKASLFLGPRRSDAPFDSPNLEKLCRLCSKLLFYGCERRHALKQLRLASVLYAEMLVGQPCGYTSARRAIKEPYLNQERLIDFFQRVLLLGQRRGQRTEPHWPATVFLNNGQHQPAINFIKAV